LPPGKRHLERIVLLRQPYPNQETLMKAGIALLSVLLLLGAAATAASSQGSQNVRVLNLARLPVVINQPGTYVLNRNWRLSRNYDQSPAIAVRASNVTIDLRGFVLAIAGDHGVGIRVHDSGAGFTLRNGLIGGTETRLVVSTGTSTTLRDLQVAGGTDGFELRGQNALVKNLDVQNSSVLISGSDSLLDSSKLRCRFSCVILGDDSRVTNSQIRSTMGLGVAMTGTGGVVANNTIIYTEAETAVLVRGNDNVVLNNVFLTHEDRGASAVIVRGTRNVLRDNLAAPTRGRWSTGITFETGGNYYGNNQMAADVPFDLLAADQTDWGGNFGF
jgi:hypothetical protein